MNLNKKFKEEVLGSSQSLFLFVTGLTFCIVIRLINIYGMVTSVSGDWNYLISKRYFGINYVWFCEISLIAFCLLGIALLFKSKKKIYSIALIVSCLSIASNVAFMKAGVRITHRNGIVLLEKNIQDPQAHPIALMFYERQYRKSIMYWNRVEHDKIEPNTKLYGTYLRRLKESGEDAYVYCDKCNTLIKGEQLKILIATEKCPVCKRSLVN